MKIHGELRDIIECHFKYVNDLHEPWLYDHSGWYTFETFYIWNILKIKGHNNN